jgi:oligopeptide transport system permease protein
VIGFIARRLVAALGVLAVVVTLCFFLMRLIPGGPFDSEQALDPVIRANLLAAYDLDAPMHEQFGRYLERLLLHGDLGPSMRYRDYSVSEILAESLPVSLVLGGAAVVIALLLGLGAGALAAARRGTWVDTAIMFLAGLGLSLPSFVIAGVLVLLFVFYWQLLPVVGFGSLAQLVLPAVSLALPFAAAIARLFRAGLLEVLGEDWIRTARAKGRSPTAVLLVHAARPASLPVVSYLGPAVAGVLSGSLVIENIFAIPGVGTHFVESALNADYNLALGVVIVYTLLLTLANLAVDVAYGLIDPRIEVE